MYRYACTIAMVGCLVSPLAAAERLGDRELSQLVERIDDQRDRFEDALDPALKRSILRGPQGEVDVARFLDDFQDSVDRLKDRLTRTYAASTEAAAVLRQGSAIERFVRDRPVGYKGASEWAALSASLATLASAYGTAFPAEGEITARRIGDGELVQSAEAIKRGADRLRKMLDRELKASGMPKETREAQVREVGQLASGADAVRKRVQGRQPATSEAELLLGQASRVATLVAGANTPGAAATWTSMLGPVGTVASAFGRPGLTATR
ncbi:hypothetical protein TBR22_A03760 [Luteitalea sp. TBR-22]|uniref:hypothetical protein n=1 Tax=Luteitalea sp. TBR-22 TaxID=2802971 RepID=UPI001AF80485|nr:hypothetical protein [Luteitalea sp. TBR-22]BCS31176.1 hypothetical protein TBR22_A03760 [Luteitalea sp. TBR-22]